MTNEQQIIAWINYIRHKEGLSRLQTIHKGNHSGYTCPIANSLSYKSNKKIYVYLRTWHWLEDNMHMHDLPSYISSFIKDFENDKFKQYYKR